MKTKLFALLTALSLVSAPAFAEIDLTPYELPSEYGSSVQVISPSLMLVLTDKSYGRNNENTLPTSITLYDEGKIGLQIELPDYAADGTRQLYDLFAASPTRYGLITSVPSSEGERPIRFQLLLANGLTDGLVLNSQRGNYAFSADSICNRRNEGNAHFIDRYYWEGGQISSVFVEADIIWPYTYAFSDDGCLSFIADCDDGLHFRRYSPDGSLLTGTPPFRMCSSFRRDILLPMAACLANTALVNPILPPLCCARMKPMRSSGQRRSAHLKPLSP